jgi:hypothetical protein
MNMHDFKIGQSSKGSSCKAIYGLGGWVSMILIAYCVSTFLILMLLGSPPESIEECYSLLNENKLHGLLRLDILTVFAMPLYYLLFYSIYLALKNTNHEFVTLSVILTFTGLTLFLSCTSVFSYLILSEKYASAINDSERSQILAAGEAIFSSDMWRGTGAFIGGLLLQTGGLLFSVAMLKGHVFSFLGWTWSIYYLYSSSPCSVPF